jgi:hypothetical protein
MAANNDFLCEVEYSRQFDKSAMKCKKCCRKFLFNEMRIQIFNESNTSSTTSPLKLDIQHVECCDDKNKKNVTSYKQIRNYHSMKSEDKLKIKDAFGLNLINDGESQDYKVIVVLVFIVLIVNF